MPTSGIAHVLPNLPKKPPDTLPERYFSLRFFARVERGGSNNHTSPALDIRAMKGGRFSVTNRCIFGSALTIAEAISSPDILPEGRIKTRAPLCMSASRSAGRLRIRSSLVRISQPRRPHRRQPFFIQDIDLKVLFEQFDPTSLLTECLRNDLVSQALVEEEGGAFRPRPGSARSGSLLRFLLACGHSHPQVGQLTPRLRIVGRRLRLRCGCRLPPAVQTQYAGQQR